MLTREEVQRCRDALADKRDDMLEENPASGMIYCRDCSATAGTVSEHVHARYCIVHETDSLTALLDRALAERVAGGELAEILAGNFFREEMVPRADGYDGHAPMWFGWVIMDAFRAGAAYQRGLIVAPPAETAGARHLTSDEREILHDALMDSVEIVAPSAPADTRDKVIEAIARAIHGSGDE